MSNTTSGFSAWLTQQKPMYYWRVLLGGVGAWIVASAITNSTQNLLSIPQVVFVGAAIVPLCFVVFCYEQCAWAKMPLPQLLLALAAGITVGLSLGVELDTILVNSASSMQDGLLVGVAEETAKAVAVIIFVRMPSLTHRLHGLMIGVAVGAGFALAETMGYGIRILIVAIQQGATFDVVMTAVNHQLLGRAVLAMFGHVLWTGIVGAAIWRERTGTTFRCTSGVLLAFGIAVGLHGLWDGTIFINSANLTLGSLELPLIDTIIIGPLGLIILYFFITEAKLIEKAGLAFVAPPLGDALKAYLQSLGNSMRQQPAAPQPLAGYGVPMPGIMPQQPQPGMVPQMPMAWSAPAAMMPMPPSAMPMYSPACPRCGQIHAPGMHPCEYNGQPASAPAPLYPIYPAA